LRYVRDTMPGIRRLRAGRGFRYVNSGGHRVRDAPTLRRIRALAIPPAWTDVWICPLAGGHLQAVGRDDRRRKQYRYHPRWRAARDKTKYDHLITFGQALPAIRAGVERDLQLPGLPRRKVLAATVRLLEATLIRVGNEEYARQNHSFGLTTFRDRHAEIDGSTIRFQFRGKSGLKHTVELRDRRLARIVRRCQDVPGQDLFQYLDDQGQGHPIGSADVNEYLREISGHDFTAKDFRTWAGTVLAARALRELAAFETKTQARRNIVRAIASVARRLGNTKAVCRKNYVHPAVFDAYLDGSLAQTLTRRAGKELRESLQNLPPEEAAVLALLHQRLRRETGSCTSACKF
jgi:DNA topoisomerase-1